MKNQQLNGAMLRALGFLAGALMAACVSLPGVTGRVDVRVDSKDAVDATKVAADKFGGQQATGSSKVEDKLDKLDDKLDRLASQSSTTTIIVATESTTTIIVVQPTASATAGPVIAFVPHGAADLGDTISVRDASGSFTTVTGLEFVAFGSTDSTVVIAAKASGSQAVRTFKVVAETNSDPPAQEWEEVSLELPTPLTSRNLDATLNPGGASRPLRTWDEGNGSFLVNDEGTMMTFPFSNNWGSPGFSVIQASDLFAFFEGFAVMADQEKGDAISYVEKEKAPSPRTWYRSNINSGRGKSRYIRAVGKFLYFDAEDRDNNRSLLWRTDKQQLVTQKIQWIW